MRITIVAVGKVREAYWRAALEEYRRRLGPYLRLSVIEVADEPCPEPGRAREEAAVMAREAARIRERIPKDSRVLVLDIGGRMMDSVTFAGELASLPHQGCNHLVFVIGGTLGLAEDLKKEAHGRISLSRLTFPHQMVRVLLLEQIYRAMRITRGEPYHR